MQYSDQKRLNQRLWHLVNFRTDDADLYAKVERVINDGADVDYTSISKETPLHMIAKSDRTVVAGLLLDKAAERGLANYIDLQGFLGKTPVCQAVINKKYDMVKFLIQRGANVTIPEHGRWTPLYSIAHTQRTDIAKMLLEKGADMHAKSRYGHTAFFRCSPAMRRFFEAYERARLFWFQQGCDRKQNKLLLDCLDHIKRYLSPIVNCVFIQLFLNLFYRTQFVLCVVLMKAHCVFKNSRRRLHQMRIWLALRLGVNH